MHRAIRLHGLLRTGRRLCSGRARGLATAGDGASTGSSEAEPDRRSRLLSAALGRVGEEGWTPRALVLGAQDAGLGGMAHGMIADGPAELVRFFMDSANRELASHLAERGDVLLHMTPRQRLRYAMERRLRALQPMLQRWPEAMAIGAFPTNLPHTANALALLADELAHCAGYEGADLRWYTDRAVVSGVYVATELFMITDASEDNADTWAFLDRRLDEAETAEAALKPENVRDAAAAVSTLAQSLASAAASLGGPLASSAAGGAAGGAAGAPQVLQALQGLAGVVASQAQTLANARQPAPPGGAADGDGGAAAGASGGGGGEGPAAAPAARGAPRTEA